jgi:copper homeostasis protein
MNNVLVEIVCCSVDDCLEAEKGGANRIELCAALPLGGLTPSLGLFLEAKSRVRIPIMAMVRPRASGMAYSEAEFANMLYEVDLFAQYGAAGVVFGVLTRDGRIDIPRNRQLIERAGSMQKVCHRAFDVTPDPFEALEQVIDLGFTRLLTSGQKPSAMDGMDLIAKLIEKAAGRIEVMPGAGIRADTVREFVGNTHCTQVHLAPFGEREDTSTRHNLAIKYGAAEMPEDKFYGLIERDEVAAVVAEVRG